MGRWLDKTRTDAGSGPVSSSATSSRENSETRKPAETEAAAEAAYRATQRARWDLLVDLTAAERAGDRRQAQAIRRALDDHFRGPYTAAADAYWARRGFPRDPALPLRHSARSETLEF